MREAQLDISVIICTYSEGRWSELQAAVESLQGQSVPAGEIIVVVDHNEGLLGRVCTELGGVVALANSEARGLSGARNSGIAVARGELLAFLDDDATAEAHWLARLQGCFADPRVLGVGGTVEAQWLSRRPGWFPREFLWVVGCSYQEEPKGLVRVRNPFGGCSCFRREMFEGVGGFRSEIGRVGTLPVGCEETELCIRASQRWPEKMFVYEPGARIHHRVPQVRTSWGYYRSRCYAEGRSKAVVASFVGARDALASERRYIVETLARGVWRGVRDGLLGRDVWGWARAGAIVVGLAMTVAGYVRGSMAQRVTARHQAEVETSKDVRPSVPLEGLPIK